MRTKRRDLRDYLGTYESSELPARWKVQVLGDTSLALIRQHGSSFRLDRAFEDAFRNPSGFLLARFMRDPRGEVIAMELTNGDRAQYLRFDRKR